MSTVFAIDPGTEQSAFVDWNPDEKVIANKGILSNRDMLNKLRGSILDELAIEMVASYGMPVGKEVFETCVWIGKFSEASNAEANYLYRKDVKMFLCGSMKAKDSNIRQALLDMLGKDVCKGVSKDVWAALAVAVTYISKFHGEAK